MFPAFLNHTRKRVAPCRPPMPTLVLPNLELLRRQHRIEGVTFGQAAGELRNGFQDTLQILRLAQLVCRVAILMPM